MENKASVGVHFSDKFVLGISYYKKVCMGLIAALNKVVAEAPADLCSRIVRRNVKWTKSINFSFKGSLQFLSLVKFKLSVCFIS